MTILNNFYLQTIAFLPNLIASLILLIIGWIVGVIVKKVTKEILKGINLDKMVFGKRKTTISLTNIIAIIFEWTIYLVFIQAAVQVLGIQALVDFLNGILSFIPGLVEAVILVVAGYLLAEYVKLQIEKSEMTYSNIIGTTLFFIILYVSIALALPLIGIDPFLINAILLVILGSLGAGAAIAIGLGLKDVVRELAIKQLKTKRKRK